jgi:hypothetical protein
MNIKPILLLWVLLLPCFLMAQGDSNGDGAEQDSTQQKPAKRKREPGTEYTPKQNKQTSGYVATQETKAWDIKNEGLFKALFHLGLNGAQIDGDDFAGYYRLGLDAGVGAMVRFHKYFSFSMFIDYSMKGAKEKLNPSRDTGYKQLYQVQWDYVEVPILLNIHDKNIIMFSVGPQIGAMVRYKEFNFVGQDVTANPQPYGQPHRIDLEAVAALHFLIKQRLGIGLKFSYSMLKLRGSQPGNGFGGEYNNVLTLQAMYILSTVKKKK